MLQKFLKILYVLLPLIIILIFLIDLFSFYSGIVISQIFFVREMIIFGIIFLAYNFMKHHLHYDEHSIGQNLSRLSIIIAANYLIKFLLDIFFDPLYSNSFPPLYQTKSAIFVSMVMAFVAAVTFVPAILILKQLIFYKRKKRTALFFNLVLGLALLNALSVFFTEQPVGWFRFSAETFANDVTTLLMVIFIIILSFRNEWITYLPRRMKLIYFFVGIPFFLAVSFLFDSAYRTPLPAYSLTIAALSYSMWLFLVIYSGIALVKLLFHLPTARAFDRKIRELDSLYQLGRVLSSETRREKLLQLITQLSSEVLESEATWLALYNPQENNFTVASSRNLNEEELAGNPLLQMTSMNKTIAAKKEALLINDVSHNRQFRHLLQWNSNGRTIIGAPLYNSRDKLTGIIYALKTKEYTFDVDDLSLLQGIANQASIALENAHLVQASIEQERLEHELEVARDVQKKLLPQVIPNVQNFSIDALSLPAYEVGGDYYDFFWYKDGKPGIVVGDVSGKGTSAALYMAEFKGIVQTLADHHNSPFELAAAANRLIYPNIERHFFISAIFAKIDPDKCQITFARAGHTPILHCGNHDQGANNIYTPGLGLGLDAGDRFEQILQEKTLYIKDGDTLLFYTDGLIEARDPEGNEFGEERLLDLFTSCTENSAEKIKDNLLNTVVDFCGKTPLHDDLTFIVLKCKARQPDTQ
ncbi:MAG: GAF domain-containing SpoIIE family protein phosphatase [Calditrichia bacterium]